MTDGCRPDFGAGVPYNHLDFDFLSFPHLLLNQPHVKMK